MADPITSAFGKVLGSATQNVIIDGLLKKASGFVDTQFRDPKLVLSIEEIIREKYGKETFFNDFDAYIKGTDTINKVIEMFYGLGKVNILSEEAFSKENLELFSKEYPKYGPYETSKAKECFDLIYSKCIEKLLILSPHTDVGKIQIFDAVLSAKNTDEHKSMETKIDYLVERMAALSIPSNELTNSVFADVGETSEAVKAFLKRIEAVGTKENPAETDSIAISKFQALLAEVPIMLRGENQRQLDMVICSLQCRIALHHSNIGNVEKAFECLSTIDEKAAEESKLYHFVYAVIIINHCIRERDGEATFHINKALEIDSNYHRAFLLQQYLFATKKEVTLDRIQKDLDSRFDSIVSENKDRDLIADYYSYRALIHKEYEEYDLAEKDFMLAKEYGYDSLIADYNIGLLYYGKATAEFPKEERLFCVKIDASLILEAVKLYKKWLFDKDSKDIPLYIKTRMVAIYASCCSLLGIKHELKPIREYLHLPNLEYEALRTLILGCDDAISEENMAMLSPEDQQYAKIANAIHYKKYPDIKKHVDELPEEELAKVPFPTVYLILQASVINHDLDTFKRVRSLIDKGDSLGLIECIDAYALEQEENIDGAKLILDKFAVSSFEYKLLRNILNFYVRNNYHIDAETLLIRILDLSLENKLLIEDKIEFCKNAIPYLIGQKSVNAKRFVDYLDEDNSESWRLKAGYYSSIEDVPRLLDTLDWLCENDFEYQFGYNKIVCLIKLMRYDQALVEAKSLLPKIHENDSKNRTQLIWVISNINLYLGNAEESLSWAKQAHELNKETPSDSSHQAFLARSTRLGKTDEVLGLILEHKEKHPKMTGWLKKVELPKKATGEEFANALREAIGENSDDFKKREQDFLNMYKTTPGCPNAMILKYYHNDYSQFFIFAEKNKIQISSGVMELLSEEVKQIKKDVFVDATTLILLQRCECLEALKEVQHVHICYATLEVIQNKYQTLDWIFVQEIIDWLKSAPNIVFESNGYDVDSPLVEIFGKEYIVCCRKAAEKNIPLVTLETSIADIARFEEVKGCSSIKAIGVVALCYAMMSKQPKKLHQMLHNLMKCCAFINFQAETIYFQIEKNSFVIDESYLKHFFICNSNCDMLSFERVYIGTIMKLKADHAEAAEDFASLVLNDAMRIWKKSTHNRSMAEFYDDEESKMKVQAVIQYLISIETHIKQIFGKDLSLALEAKCKAIMNSLFEEAKKEYFRTIKEQIV